MARRLTGFPCWCGRNAWRSCFRTARFALLRCRCGAYRIDPPPLKGEREAEAFYARYYEHPAASGSPPRGRLRTFRFWQVVNRVPELGRARGRVADIGCGEGHLCADLSDAGWASVAGVDVSSPRIRRARSLYPHIEFYDRPLTATGLPRNGFDLIVMDNVLEHLLRPAAVLRDARHYLKPGGWLVVITPNMDSGQFRALGRFWTPELAPHVHVFLFSSAALHRLLEHAGFAVTASGSFHTPAPPLHRLWVDLRSGAFRAAVWRALQKAGDVYAHLVGAGPMLYAVAHPAVAAPAVRVI